MRRLSIWFLGSLALFGAALQFTTSLVWTNFEQNLNATMSVGEYIFLAGQGIGELCYLVCLLHFFNVKKVLWCAMGFVVDLALVDCVDILFFTPLEHHLSKYIGVIFAFIILLIRLKSYEKRNS